MMISHLFPVHLQMIPDRKRDPLPNASILHAFDLKQCQKTSVFKYKALQKPYFLTAERRSGTTFLHFANENPKVRMGSEPNA